MYKQHLFRQINVEESNFKDATPQENQDVVNWKRYLPFFSFSCTIVSLLATLSVLVLNKYRKHRITKLSLQPHKIALQWLLINLIQQAIKFYLIYFIFDGDPNKIYASKNWFIIFFFFTYGIKFMVFAFFVQKRSILMYLLGTFMVTQNFMRVEDLDVYKRKFQKFEKSVYQTYHRMEQAYFVAWLISESLFFFPPKSFAKINVVFRVSIALLFLTVLTTLAMDNFISYTSVLKQMKQWHIAEYGKHKVKIYADFITTQILLVVLFIYGTFSAWFMACSLKMDHFESKGEQGPIIYEQTGACNIIVNEIYWTNPQLQTIINDLVEIICLIIIMIYVGLNQKPHDCYRCFGKNPDQPFSRFQMNKFEHQRRKDVAKFGQIDDKKNLKTLRYSLSKGLIEVGVNDQVIMPYELKSTHETQNLKRSKDQRHPFHAQNPKTQTNSQPLLINSSNFSRREAILDQHSSNESRQMLQLSNNNQIDLSLQSNQVSLIDTRSRLIEAECQGLGLDPDDLVRHLGGTFKKQSTTYYIEEQEAEGQQQNDDLDMEMPNRQSQQHSSHDDRSSSQIQQQVHQNYSHQQNERRRSNISSGKSSNAFTYSGETSMMSSQVVSYLSSNNRLSTFAQPQKSQKTTSYAESSINLSQKEATKTQIQQKVSVANNLSGRNSSIFKGIKGDKQRNLVVVGGDRQRKSELQFTYPYEDNEENQYEEEQKRIDDNENLKKQTTTSGDLNKINNLQKLVVKSELRPDISQRFR